MGAEKKAGAELRERIETTVERSGAQAASVAFHDYESDTHFSYQGDRWMHAASTIKVPVLVGVFAAIEDHDLSLASRVHVRTSSRQRSMNASALSPRRPFRKW